MHEMMKDDETVGYARVSTDRDDQLNSLENQLYFFRQYFTVQGYKGADTGVLCRKDGSSEPLQSIYADEGISGKNLRKREAFKQMMKDAKIGKFKWIVTKSVSRFGRNVEDTVRAIKDLKELGVGVYFLDLKINSLDSSKEMMINLFAVFAQEDNNGRSYNSQYGIRKAQEQGKWTTGTPPYGYDIKGGFLAINEREAPIVERIYQAFYYESFGLGKLARELNEKGIPTKKNAQWSQKQISSILENPIYTGKQTVHKKQVIDINRQIIKQIPPEEQIVHHFEHLRIIEPGLFTLVQDERAKRTDMFGKVKIVEQKSVNDDGDIVIKKVRQLERSKTRYSNQHLFSNLLYCDYCGTALKRKKRHSYRRKDGTEKDIGYEWCCAMNDMYGKARCPHRSAFAEDDLLAYIQEEIGRQKYRLDDFDLPLENYLSVYYDPGDVHLKIKQLDQKIEELNQEVTTNLRLVTKEILSDEQFKTINDAIQEQLTELKSQRYKLNHLEKDIEDVKLRHNAFIKLFETIDVKQITNSSLRKLIRKIVIMTVAGGVRRVHIEWNYMDVTYSEFLRDMMADKESAATIPV